MSFRSFITKALGIVTDTGTKAVTGVFKDISGTAKDVVDIRKGLVETKVAEIKIEQHESQIQKATLEDVKKYDPKARLFFGFGGGGEHRYNPTTLPFILAVLLIIASALVALIYWGTALIRHFV